MKNELFSKLVKADSDSDFYNKLEELAEVEEGINSYLTSQQAEILEDKFGSVTFYEDGKNYISPYIDYSPNDCIACSGTGFGLESSQCEECNGTGKKEDI